MLNIVVDGKTFRATSTKTRIETQKTNLIYWLASTFRATSTKTRIETLLVSDGVPRYRNFQSDIHQNKDWNRLIMYQWLTKSSFQSDIHQNKDWNSFIVITNGSTGYLSERHPRKQGLKLPYPRISPVTKRLSERHPRKQGLKQDVVGGLAPIIGIFQSDIHENKDWNSFIRYNRRGRETFRATSTKTRIETFLLHVQIPQVWFSFRATSTKTRIETQCYLIPVQG